MNKPFDLSGQTLKMSKQVTEYEGKENNSEFKTANVNDNSPVTYTPQAMRAFHDSIKSSFMPSSAKSSHIDDEIF